MAGAKWNNASSPRELVQLINPIINERLNKFNQNPQGQKFIPYNGIVSHASLCMFVQCRERDCLQQQQIIAARSRKILSEKFMTTFYKSV
jgi:hypothetical protein